MTGVKTGPGLGVVVEEPESWVSRPGTNTQTPHCPQTPLTSSEESLDFSVSLEQVRVQRGGAGRGPAHLDSGLEPAGCASLLQASTERVLRAGKQLHRHLLANCPNLIRDRKHHLRLHR